jgi:hypothetical protein
MAKKPKQPKPAAPEVLRAILDAKQALFRVEPDELRRLAGVISYPGGGESLAGALRFVATGVEDFRRRLENIEAGREPLDNGPSYLIE